MKNLIIAALAASTVVAAPAFGQAQENAPGVTINLAGSVPLQCAVTGGGIDNPEPISLTNTSGNQTVGSLTYTCNNAGGFTRTIASANAGVLKRVGGAANEANVPYQFVHGGGSGLNFTAASLATPRVTSLGGAFAFINGQTGAASILVGAPTGSLFAGAYTDTVTVTVSPN